MTLKQDVAERAYLVAVCWNRGGRPLSHERRALVLDHLEELTRLAESAGAIVVGTSFQERARPDPATLIGKGKVEELALEIKKQPIQVVIFDEELTPAQNRNLEKALECKVIDRTGLILDIFAARARSREGKTQVELAQLEYLYPRLVGRWMHFSRQEGGIGMRGPGETQLEVDRRIVKSRMTMLSRNLSKMKKDRDVQRRLRKANPLPRVSLVGYTNAGKSSLLNQLSGSHEYTDDLLFATLDPVTRRVRLKQNLTVLFNDTVGLVQKLPHQLIAAFRSTFEEITDSDLLLHVIDAHHPQADIQAQEVIKVLKEFSADQIPLLTVYNKVDLLAASNHNRNSTHSFYVSAMKGFGIEALKEAIIQTLAQRWPLVSLRLPVTNGRMRAQIYDEGEVVQEKLSGNFLELQARLPEKLLLSFRRYIHS